MMLLIVSATQVAVIIGFILKFFAAKLRTYFHTSLIHFADLTTIFVDSAMTTRCITNTKGIPSVSYFADKANLSAGYFGDLIRKKIGTASKDLMALHSLILFLRRFPAP
jgi:5-bromo-4-chloroindolyl phosphate hydrolysis protein